MTQVKTVRPIVLFERAEGQKEFGGQKSIKPALDVFQAGNGLSSLTLSDGTLPGNLSFRKVSDKGPEYKSALNKLLTDSEFRKDLQSLLSKATDPTEKLRILEESGFPADLTTLQKVEGSLKYLEADTKHPLEQRCASSPCIFW
ncbi:MAG: hypothetical protein JXA94_01525 [Parachlamydiales bacterium]|nr:hypothetical protein [Parachlamydiales bacterium]